jgi:RNA polymerase sigma-70 factor (ECF subfamily)
MIEKDVLKYYNNLFGYAMSFTKDKQKANDLVQDTIIRALRKKHMFQGDSNSNLKSWLYIILKNLYINNYRKKIVRQSVTLPEKKPALNKALYSFLEKDFITELKRLDYLHKKTILLFMKGFKYKEIAEMTRSPIGTVKARLFRIRKILKDLK